MEQQLLKFYQSALSNHFCKLSEPLKNAYCLDGFFYTYLSPEGLFFQIGNHPEVGETYFGNQLHKYNPCFCHPDNYEHNHIYITDDLKHESFHKAQKNIERAHGFKNFLFVSKKEEGCAHLFAFSASNPAIPTNQIFIENHTTLSRFAEFALSSWKEHFTKMETYLINIKEVISHSYDQESLLFNYSPPKKGLTTLAKAIGLLDEFISFDKLSKREKECAKLALKGMNAPQIADTLGIGKRTVFDYMDKVKLKMVCENKYELIVLLQELERVHLI